MSHQRVSEVFGLSRTQGSLDFLDVFDSTDLAVYVDARAIRLLDSERGQECVFLMQDFFQSVLDAIRSGDVKRAKYLLLQLREPNEVRLGQSTEKPRGSALGDVLAGLALEALSESEAVKTGLLRDLEDSVLMIPHVDKDRISDVTINIIREPLVRYTQQICEEYGIPLQQGVDPGPMWDPKAKDWYSEPTQLPVTDHDKLILVPKAIVRRELTYDVESYYRHYVAPVLQREEKDRNSELVELLKNGEKRVTKKAIYEKFGRGKKAATRETLRRPEILDRYRRDKADDRSGPMDHDDIADRTGAPIPDWDVLLDAISTIDPGHAGATAYHDAVESLLTALLYPSLVMPIKELPIHGDRKRIDISYTNVVADDTFFGWVGRNYPAANVFVECKNYSIDPNNPELDQLAGRFSPSRGKVGLLVYRTSDDKQKIIQRCVDAAHDDRGWMIPLDDDDLRQLVDERRSGTPGLGLLRERFDQLIL